MKINYRLKITEKVLGQSQKISQYIDKKHTWEKLEHREIEREREIVERMREREEEEDKERENERERGREKSV